SNLAQKLLGVLLIDDFDEQQIPTDHGRFEDGVVAAGKRDHRLALRGSRGGGWAFDRKVVALVIDVVRFIAIDEPAGSCVANFGVVFPAVPKFSDHGYGFLGFTVEAVEI